jgi:hypothetical protein
MHRFFLFTFCILIISINAQSPITLTSANFPGSGDTLRYSNAQINSAGNYTQTGANYNWDFSNLVYTSQGRRDFKLSFQTPYAFFFIGLNEYGEKISDTLGAGPLTITNFYNFYRKQTTPTNAYVADGSGMTFSSVPVASYFSNKDELYNFPLTYPKYDSTTFKFSTPTTTLLPIRYSKTGYRVSKIDGWGTVKTPYGTANCLRMVTTQYSQDTIKTAFPFPLGFPNNTRSYQWLTSSSKIPFLEISGNLIGNNFTPNSVRYRDNYFISNNTAGIYDFMDISAMQFYPNPGKDKLCLLFNHAGEFDVTILDLQAKKMKQLNTGYLNTLYELDINDLEPSIYVIKVTESNRSYYYKFIKE